MNQASATAIVKNLFEKHFFTIADSLTNGLNIPGAFVKYPTYPGMSIAVNGQRVLVFDFLDRPLIGEPQNATLMNFPKEAACFAPYMSSKGPMITFDTDELASEASMADIPEEALLEILALHEMVHASMMGRIAQRFESHPWIVDAQFRYIHEAVALKVTEFGLASLLEVATPKHIEKYLSHIQSVASSRTAGSYYRPYFDTYRSIAPQDFWPALRSSQPSPGIFESVEGLT